MQFVGKKTNLEALSGGSPVVKKEFKLSNASPSFLLMYSQPPDYTIEFDNFASLALERFSGDCKRNVSLFLCLSSKIILHFFIILKVLQMVENVGTRCMKGSADYMSKLDTEFRKIGFIKSILCNVKLF